jgi:hypothetical protein
VISYEGENKDWIVLTANNRSKIFDNFDTSVLCKINKGFKEY